MKQQLVSVQLDKDAVEELKAAAENEVKKTKADCDELKEQIADLRTALDLSEAKRSSLLERIEKVTIGKQILYVSFVTRFSLFYF